MLGYLIDMDGVLHRGAEPIPGAPERPIGNVVKGLVRHDERRGQGPRPQPAHPPLGLGTLWGIHQKGLEMKSCIAHITARQELRVAYADFRWHMGQ